MKAINMSDSARTLKDNKAFLDLMRGLYTITAFDSVVNDGATSDTLNKINGKREVWAQLRAQMNLPAETLTLIEHYKYMKEAD